MVLIGNCVEIVVNIVANMESQVTIMKNGNKIHNRWSLISVLIVVAVQLNFACAGVLNGADKRLEMTNNSVEVTTIPGVDLSPERNATTSELEQEQSDDKTTRGPAKDRSHIYKNLRRNLESMPESCQDYEVRGKFRINNIIIVVSRMRKKTTKDNQLNEIP